MDAIFFKISKKYGFQLPSADEFEINLKFNTLMHKHCVISKAIIRGDRIDFRLLVEEGINVLPAIVQTYGPYLEFIEIIFSHVAVCIQKTHCGLSEEHKLHSMDVIMNHIQMSL